MCKTGQHLGPGHAHFPWQLSSRVSQLGMRCGPSWTRPFIMYMRPEVDVRMRWECMVRYGATPRNPGIPTHAQSTKVGGVASP